MIKVLTSAAEAVDTPKQAHTSSDPSEVAETDGDCEAIIVWEDSSLTDEEAAVIERKLDAESSEGKITFGSAKEASDFLRSRIKRTNG